jgi:hypothetical protein
VSFKFCTVDKFDQLHPNIASNLKSFLKNRIVAFDGLKSAVAKDDLEIIRAFCHTQLGVASCYNCFRLEEITKHIQGLVKKKDINAIKAIMPIFQEYVSELKSNL